MYDEMAFIGRNLNARTIKAVESFQTEASRIGREAAAAGAFNSSRTFIQYWEAGLAILERETNSAIQFVYNATGEHTGEVYDQIAFCSKQMLERIVGDVRQKAAANDQAFGGGYADIVNRMLVVMQEKRELLLDNFKHGMMGDNRLKKDAIVNAVINQSNSPGAVAQVGAGTFSQTAFTQQQHQLVQAIEQALNSPEFAALSPDQQQGFRDIADVVKAEASSANPDTGKLQRWGKTLVSFATDVGMKLASSTIAHVLVKIFT